MVSDTQLVRKIVKVGNSAGVVLPREWLNGTARVELVRKPLNIKKDVLEILEPYLEDVVGVYLTGSYAREEETEKSDVDVLVITNKIGKTIEEGKYSIGLVPKASVERALENNAMMILPRVKEAKALINKELIEKYKKTELTRKNLKSYFDIVGSGMKVNDSFLKIAEEDKDKLGDGNAYSLILNLRTVYMIDCIIKNKMWTNKELLSLIRKLYGNLEIYEGYLRSKTDLKWKDVIEVEGARKVYEYIIKKLEEHKRWLKARKE